MPNPQAGGDPFAACEHLFNTFIATPPYLEPVYSICIKRMCHTMVTRDTLNTVLIPMYSQPPSISGGCLLHLHHEDVPCCGANGPG